MGESGQMSGALSGAVSWEQGWGRRSELGAGRGQAQ